MSNAGSRIVTAIEAAWEEIRVHHPEVPEVVVVTGAGFAAKKAKWGHFWAERWKDGDETARKPELFVAGELLGMPGRRIMQTLLHEAAHGLNYARGEKGTNINGRHNKTFLRAAEELGDAWPEGKAPHPTIGFSAVEITDDAAQRYADTIACLETARLAHLEALLVSVGGAGGTGTTGTTPTGGRGSRGGTKGGKRPNAVCGCSEPDPFPISPGRLARRPILCGECREPFRHEDSEDAAA
ncbi:hypothetical protein NLX83_13160 [Allokutzneria sp. A3M-2-11 16]|uniref:hypothetical protein n=1 Tax=Allokutzneria sp. A3M-2-11 16 TaxID=2962043 RepID=UPI0020B76B33|nr:hypothetical protein [Allokutzneria sp. A3M-2-11 16]MCP3800208.1 hypothetical protein [Allokutzneria sp. A3M-2-11 16]